MSAHFKTSVCPWQAATATGFPPGGAAGKPASRAERRHLVNINSSAFLRQAGATLAVAGFLVGTAACGPEKPGGGKAAASVPAQASPTAPTGNGIADKSAEAIMKAATDAFSSATSVHLTGTMVDAGDTITMDLHLGHGVGEGTIRGPIKGKSLPVSIIAAKGRFYMKSRRLWTAVGGATAGDLIGDRWVLVPKKAMKNFKGFDGMLSSDGFARMLLKPDGPLTKGGTTVVDGTPAIELKSGGGSLYVATTGNPYPLKIVPSDRAKESLRFLDYDAPLRVDPPARPLDVSKLGG
jgi:hypothetical protein